MNRAGLDSLVELREGARQNFSSEFRLLLGDRRIQSLFERLELGSLRFVGEAPLVVGLHVFRG